MLRDRFFERLLELVLPHVVVEPDQVVITVHLRAHMVHKPVDDLTGAAGCVAVPITLDPACQKAMTWLDVAVRTIGEAESVVWPCYRGCGTRMTPAMEAAAAATTTAARRCRA